ncbi:AbrB/MazE/SpoVT family DNA-binding domain-containing protein [Halomontanus rarus]|uniref:AbrB/MazE/SpoVT family DNA-binding domain-containing protein n=1 Tax=Halomontanus rarus TaxID=3034020 RepID=UPI001A97F1C4
MTNSSFESNHNEEFTLEVDESGRLLLPKKIRERLGIELNDEVSAILVESVLKIDPRPSSKLETATAGQDDWENTTPTDAGGALFGSEDREDESHDRPSKQQ